jgi:phosphoglycolate phosphatase-like HAD superfamily hydrolase
MALDLARIQAVCFDIDGTLRDTDDQYMQRLARVLAPLRLFYPPRSPQDLAHWLVHRLESPGSWMMHLSDHLWLDGPITRLRDLVDWIGDRGQPADFLLVPGVDALLASLHGRYPLAVISARRRQPALDFLAHFGLGEYFSVIITGQTTRYTKPHPDPLLYAAQRLGLAPGALLMVGDTTADILAGRLAGAQTAAVLCGFGEQDELARAGADLIVDSTADLEQALL